MPPKKKNQLVKKAAPKKVTKRQLNVEEGGDSPRSKRQRSRGVPDLLQVPFESPSASRASRASRDLSKNQNEEEEEEQTSRSSEEGTEDAEPGEAGASHAQVDEQRGESGASRQVSGAREGRRKAVHDLPATTQATTHATTQATTQDQSVQAAEQEVELADEVIPCIKTDLPDLSLMKTWLEYNNAFATKKVTARSSMHLKMEKFRTALNKFKLMERFKGSCFGHLIDLPKSVFAPKLIHNILLRRVICHKNYEVWFKFHDLPLRFGMQEFALMAKLSCALPPPDEFMEEHRRKGKDLWDFVSRKGKKAANGDYILELIESEDLVKDDDTRFSLCLCWFEHQVLCSKDTNSGIEE